MAQRYFDFEGGSNGTALTGALAGTGASNPVVDAGGSATFSNSSSYQGGLHGRYAYVTGGSTGVMQQFAPAGTNTLLAWTFAFRIVTDTSTATWANIAAFRTAGAPLYSVRIEWTNPGGVARLYLFSGATNLGQIGTVTLNENASTWYRVSGEVNGSTGAFEVRLRQGSNDAMIGSALTGTDAGMVGTIAASRFGINGSVAVNTTIDIDWIGFNDGSASEMPASISSSPVANAGAHITALPGSTVSLNGSASTGVTSYAWSFIWPSSGAPALTGASTANPTFTAGPVGSVYALNLTVSDGSTSSSVIVNVAVVSSEAASSLNELVWVDSVWR